MKLFLVFILGFVIFSCQARNGDSGGDGGGNGGSSPSSQSPSHEIETVMSGGFEISGTTEMIVNRKISGAFVIEGVINE